MVSTVGGRETLALFGPVIKYHSGKGTMLPREQCLRVALDRVGWSRQGCSLTVDEVRKVG